MDATIGVYLVPMAIGVFIAGLLSDIEPRDMAHEMLGAVILVGMYYLTNLL